MAIGKREKKNISVFDFDNRWKWRRKASAFVVAFNEKKIVTLSLVTYKENQSILKKKCEKARRRKLCWHLEKPGNGNENTVLAIVMSMKHSYLENDVKTMKL